MEHSVELRQQFTYTIARDIDMGCAVKRCPKEIPEVFVFHRVLLVI